MVENINAIRSMISDGISLIPVRGVDGGKRPYGKWKGEDGEVIPNLSFEELIKSIDFYSEKYGNCENVAIRTGKLSSGVVCIDVDTKHKKGFGAIILDDLRNIYPDIYLKLRIDKTPSGGYHFYYRVGGYESRIGGLVSMPQLASRLASDEELKIDPKRKKFNFLEFKSDGGLSHCYPSKNYLRIKESGSLVSFKEADYDLVGGACVGILSLEDHNNLISHCRLYDEIIEVKESKIKGNVENLYSENPFEHFNKSNEGARVLYDEGWSLFGTHGKFERYQRPGKKDKEIGATFNLETRIYRIFTTNADIEARGFTPAGLLNHFKFNGDFGQLYHYLVAKGFGKLKPSIEKNIVKNAVRSGSSLPQNVSESGKREYTEKVEKQKEKYQYGIFWEALEDGGYRISREFIYRVGRDMGFRSFKDRPVLIDGYIVRNVDERYFFDKIKDYIIYGSFGWKTKVVQLESVAVVSDCELEGFDNIGGFDLDNMGACEDLKLENLLEKELNDTDVRLLDAYESFLQNSGKFTLSRLPILDTSSMLKSGKRVSYKFYKNCYVKIDEDSRESVSYENMNYLIWDTEIINREFEFISNSSEFVDSKVKESLYYQFVNNAIGWSEYLTRCIGFCAHDYRDEESYFILCSEKMENPNEGGGSGKNIFCNLFKQITSVKVSASAMVKKDNQFLQSWNYQRLFVLADLQKKFDWEFFKEIINGEGSVRKLYKDEFDVGIHDMPKFIGSTNFSFDILEPGIRRRVRQIEFSDYYIKRDGVSTVTGKRFPTASKDDVGDWDENEFRCFDNIMISCIQAYLKGKCRIEEAKMSDSGWSKQFELKFTHLYDFFREKKDEWLFLKQVPNKLFNEHYDLFLRENNINKRLSSHTINIALTEYFSHYSVDFKYKFKRVDGSYSDGIIWRDHLKNLVRGRLFGIQDKERDEDDSPNVYEQAPF